MKPCCIDKMYFSELCENCIKDMTTIGMEGALSPYEPEVILKCECGAEATGGPGHSSWCPKFSP